MRLRGHFVVTKLLIVGVFASAYAAGQSLAGVVDVHAHWGPDSLPRSIDALSLVRLAKQRGFRAIVLKSHYEPTAALAGITRKEVP